MVRFETHFLGGLRHWAYDGRNWEIADIGVLVMFRENGRLVRTKIALLQSKRLYAKEQSAVDDEIEDYKIGFGRLFYDGIQPHSQMAPRTFEFDESCRYSALSVSDGQYRAIEDYERARSVPVYYLLYNPLELPWAVTVPSTLGVALPKENKMGTRVIPSAAVRAQNSTHAVKGAPTVLDLRDSVPSTVSGWSLQHFVADRLLRCYEGHQIKGAQLDDALSAVFYRRSGPIAAAFSITIDGPTMPDSPARDE